MEFGHEGGQGRVSFAPMGHRHHRGPLLPGSLGEQEGELALTRD